MKNDLELSDFRYDIDRLVNEICMDENKSEMYILVEGTNDRDVYAKFMDIQKVSFVICDGKANVYKIYDSVRMRKGHGKYVYAIVDLDYDWYFGRIRNDSHILYTDSHDLEIMILYSDDFEHIFKGLYSKGKVLELGGIDNFRHFISNLCIRIGMFRIISVEQKLNLQFKANSTKDKEFSYKKVISKGVYLGDEVMINAVKCYKNQAPCLNNEDAIAAMDAIPRKENDEKLILHGHDVTSVMALLAQTFGKKDLDITKREQVELNFRLAYNFRSFKQTILFKNINQLALQQALSIWND